MELLSSGRSADFVLSLNRRQLLRNLCVAIDPTLNAAHTYAVEAEINLCRDASDRSRDFAYGFVDERIQPAVLLCCFSGHASTRIGSTRSPKPARSGCFFCHASNESKTRALKAFLVGLWATSLARYPPPRVRGSV